MNDRTADFERLATVIARRTGLTFPRSRQRDMEEALSRALEDSTEDPARLETVLEQDTTARDELIASLTVGESYFFRDRDQFALLREQIIPSLAETRDHGPLRIWSAGCAAGEEAYSLAILCSELRLGGRARVLGTDISRVRLAMARQGLYTPWALRGLEAEAIDRYFTRVGKHFAVNPQYRRLVDFRYLNLAEDLYPSLTAGVWGFDLILCRNVLIYFDRETIARVARRLIDSLAEDGWLLLGASDPALTELVECEVVLTRSGLAYRRPGQRIGDFGVQGIGPGGSASASTGSGGEGEGPRHATRVLTKAQPGIGPGESSRTGGLPPIAPGEAGPGAVSPPSATGDAARDAAGVPRPDVGPGQPVAGAGHADRDIAVSAVRAAYDAHDYERAATLATGLLRTHDIVELHVLRVRALANLGDVKRAGRALDVAIRAHRGSAELMHLQSVLLGETGRWRDAAAAARRALYIDRRMVVAHMAMAQALKRSGDIAGARRALRNAASLLAALPGDAVVRGSDGESVARLRTNVEAQLRMLEEAA